MSVFIQAFSQIEPRNYGASDQANSGSNRFGWHVPVMETGELIDRFIYQNAFFTYLFAHTHEFGWEYTYNYGGELNRG